MPKKAKSSSTPSAPAKLSDTSDDPTMAADHTPVGDRALKVLAENTGGAAFVPGSVRWLNRSLDDLQEVIRSRYLISYKPALFQRDGRYRSIDISAEKSGHKLRVYCPQRLLCQR